MISGRLTPLRLFNGPPTTTSASKLCVSTDTTLKTSLPSSINNLAPRYIALKISACGRPTMLALPISVFRSKVMRSPFLTIVSSATLPTRNFGPCKSARIQHGVPVLASSARIASMRAPCSSRVPCEKFNRKTFTPAVTNLPSMSGLDDASPRVATIFVARCGWGISTLIELYVFLVNSV